MAFTVPQPAYESTITETADTGATSLGVDSTVTDLGKDLDGLTLSFLLDKGKTTQEFVQATVDTANSQITSISYLDNETGEVSGAGTQYGHRVGQSTIEIADFPYITHNTRALGGLKQLDSTSPMEYDGNPTFTPGSNEVATVKYIDDTAIAGAPDATETVKGIVEKGTTGEIDAGTATGGTGANLFVSPDNLATSIYSTQLPSADEKDALAGTSGTPDNTNKYVTDDDTNGTGDVLRDSRIVVPCGDGSDGALTITSGTTNLDFSSSSVLVKNYSSIEISGTGQLGFTNPNAAGSVAILYSTGDVTITSSATPAVDLTDLGPTPGSGGAGSSDANGNDGNDGAAAFLRNTVFLLDGDTNTTEGIKGIGSTGTGTTGGAGGAGLTVLTSLYDLTNTTDLRQLVKGLLLRGTTGASGAGAGSGKSASASTTGNGGDGGRGAGSLIIISGGDLNFTGEIDASGTDGQDGGVGTGVNHGGSGGGGGGAGGFVALLSKTQTSVAGTTLVDGGDGGDGSDCSPSPAVGSSGGGSGGGGGASILYTGGVGGDGGEDLADPGTAGTNGAGAGGGTGGSPGTNDNGTYGAGASGGSGGGGGGGGAGLSVIDVIS